MKTYEVTVRDISSRRIQVDADNTEEAIKIALRADGSMYYENQDLEEEVIRVEVIE